MAAAPPGPDALPGTAPASRTRGLLYGSFYGDALGGPIEFQSREAIQKLEHPVKLWRADEVLDAAARREAAGRLRLREYGPLRPAPESYGQWNARSEAGTITDDSRHKLVLLYALGRAEAADQWPMNLSDFARAHLSWPEQDAIRTRPEYVALAKDWLEEWQFAARWILGERDFARARPPERMWVGLPTCCGQMTLPPLAALFPGRPEKAYRAAFQLGFFDNGWGRDLNAALVAGLSRALAVEGASKDPKAAWQEVFRAMRTTDPFGYGKVRWTQRSVDRWLDLARRMVTEAQGKPARFFDSLEAEFRHNSKWEAQVPVVVAMGCIELADYDPLAAMQLTLEWGWDTDSYAQILGAFVGALHGEELFPAEDRQRIRDRALADFRVDLNDECDRMIRLERRARTQDIISEARTAGCL